MGGQHHHAPRTYAEIRWFAKEGLHRSRTPRERKKPSGPLRRSCSAPPGVNGAHAFPSGAQPSEALHFDFMFLERIPDLAGCQAQQACGFGLNPAGFLHGLDQHVLAKMR